MSRRSDAKRGWHLYSSSYALAQVPRSQFHRLDNLRIGGAAAEVAGEVVADLGIGRVRGSTDELAGHQDEPRGTEAALGGSAFAGSPLDRVGVTVCIAVL